MRVPLYLFLKEKPIPQSNNVSIINFFRGRAKTFLLPKDVFINGAIETTISGHIEGRVNGDVRSSGRIVIGRNAAVRGHVYAANLVVHGKVHGDVYVSNKAVISDKARIKGDVTAMIIEIKEGAVVEGAIRKNIAHAQETPTPETEPAAPIDQAEEDGQASTWF